MAMTTRANQSTFVSLGRLRSATYPWTVKEFVVYTALRVMLFVATVAIVAAIWLALNDGSVNWFLTVLISFLLSGVASLLLLNGQRARFAQRVEDRAARAAARFEASRAKED